MKSVYSVAQINSYIKSMFSQDYMLRSVYVKGEASNVRYHSSGHIYFTLKDKTGTLNCIMFSSYVRSLKFKLQDGASVIVFGSVEVYERDGRYQLYAKEIEAEGAGALYEKYEQLKRELEEMGMFAAEYKKMIPKYAGRIGVVTAPGGAAVRDIISISKRRNPYVQLILYPAIVQGEEAPESIVNGIRALDMMNLDVIIVGRGGGSIEDLWAFNEEIVARAIFECNTPIVSAVGHESDTTIADFVADLRAPTPSAAAELTVFNYSDYEYTCESYRHALSSAMEKCLEKNRLKMDAYTYRLKSLSPESRLRENKQRYVNLEDMLSLAMENVIKTARNRLTLNIERMKALSPLSRLSGGYAYVSTEDGRSLNSVSDVAVNDKIRLNLSDGVIEAMVSSVSEG